MRVSDRMMTNNYIYNLMNQEATLKKMNDQITSGNRITAPSDDPIGASRVMSLSTNLNEIDQYTSNSNNASTWLNTTDNALSTAISYLQRVNDLVINGASSDKPGNAFEDIAKEVNQIRDGLVDVANTTIGNNYIFAGTNITSPAYEERTPATGDARDLANNPIRIDINNNQFKIKLDQETTKTITLSSGVYDGTSGKTLNDLAADINKQLQNADFGVPVYAKATPDNRIVFYAGTTPPDGTTHSLVLTNGPAIKATGLTRVPNGTPPAGQIWLAPDASNTNSYFNGWTIHITSGTGMGQTRTITGYDGTTQIADVNSNWDITPDASSTYTITPPLSGTSIGATNNDPITGNGTIQFDPANSSQIDSFYVGMSVTVMSGPGMGETKKIVSYDHTTGIAKLDSNWTTPPTSSNYILTPPLNGTVQASGAGTITLDANASTTDGFYNGASITVTNTTGSTETKRIVSYDAATKIATLDSNWGLPPTSTSTYVIGDNTLSQLGFYNKATTKELVGNTLTGTIQVTGSYPMTGLVQAPAPIGSSNLTLSPLDSSKQDDYYKGWTLTITGGTGQGQSRTITGYTGATQAAAVDSPWTIGLDATSQYSLTPPLTGQVPGVAGVNNQIILSSPCATSTDFYKGMPITITSGNGVNQTRTITGYTYDPITQTGTATVDSPWNVLPDSTSHFSIDANNFTNTNSKFNITVGLNPPQEITLGVGNYTIPKLAKEIQTQIQARGGNYANVYVSATPENQLRFTYQDPTLGDNDNPLPIKLESGSTADILTTLGFNSGVSSETPIPTYEGDQGISEVEINQGTKVQVNTVGDKLFDSVFQHLNSISLDLRNGAATMLSNTDLKNVQDDLSKLILAQGECGAKVNRVQNGTTRLTNLKDSVTQMLSDVQDTDVSQMAVQWKALQTAYQAALMIGAKIFPETLMDYLK